MIIINNVSKEYRTRKGYKTVLKNISFSLKKEDTEKKELHFER